MHSDVAGGSHFGSDPISGKRHAVISRSGNLLAAVGIGPQSRLLVLLPSAGVGQPLADNRHDSDIEKVSDARAAQMSVREAYYSGVAVMISGAPVPLLRDARRSELHHAERHVRPDKHMSVPAGSDLRIYKGGTGVILPADGPGCAPDGHNRRSKIYQVFLHNRQFATR